MKRIIFNTATILILLIGINASANNLQISNVSLASFNSTDNYAMIQFDISWENSWRTTSAPDNWDAVWLFVKYRINSGDWQHATLNASGSMHTAATGSQIDGVSDGKGVFIYRSANGIGTNTWTAVQLRWEYGTDGVADNNAANIDVEILGIEMVYVPQGSFYIGSGGSEFSYFHQGNNVNALQITTEAVLRLGNDNATSLWATGEWDNPANGTMLAAAYPKGYNAFYCMKYEITQGQYAGFLNYLTATQESNRYFSSTSNRYTIGGTYPNHTAVVEDRACNFLSWADGIAYMDWCALRPMTELEFEKACRGTATPVANEYAWGTATIASSAYTLSNDGTATENIATNYSTTLGNALYSETAGSINGPLRSGIFAAHATNTGRITSGATYYGIMEMSGNLWERCVTVGNTIGRNFTGETGNGVLTAAGDADMANCPDNTATGSGLRGGSWSDSDIYLLTSSRPFAANANANASRLNVGSVRAVRCP